MPNTFLLLRRQVFLVHLSLAIIFKTLLLQFHCYSLSAVSMRYRSSCVLFGVESEDLIKSQAKDIKHVCSGERGIRRLYEALFISLCGEVSLSFCGTTFAILFEINSIKISISYLWVPRTVVTY